MALKTPVVYVLAGRANVWIDARSSEDMAFFRMARWMRLSPTLDTMETATTGSCEFRLCLAENRLEQQIAPVCPYFESQRGPRKEGAHHGHPHIANTFVLL